MSPQIIVYLQIFVFVLSLSMLPFLLLYIFTFKINLFGSSHIFFVNLFISLLSISKFILHIIYLKFDTSSKTPFSETVLDHSVFFSLNIHFFLLYVYIYIYITWEWGLEKTPQWETSSFVPYIVRMIKSRTIRYLDHVARMKIGMSASKSLTSKQTGKRALGRSRHR